MTEQPTNPKVKVLSLAGLLGLNPALPEFSQKTGIDLLVSSYMYAEFKIEPGNVVFIANNRTADEFDFIWLHSMWDSRDTAYALTLLLDHQKIRHSPIEPDHSKLTDFVALALQNISIPRTFFTRNQRLKKRYSQVVKYLGEPFIIKACRSTWGKGVYLIKNEVDFNKLMHQLPHSRHYVCQKFIPNKFDYRVSLSFNEVVSCERRRRNAETAEFRNNAHLGATEEFFAPCELPEPVAELAINASKVLKLDWCGVDIVPDLEEKNFYILEVNRNPGVTIGSSEVPAALEHLRKLVLKVQP